MPIFDIIQTMTVGELVYQQAIKDGYDPATAERLISPLKAVFEAHEKTLKAFEPMRESLKKSIGMANSAFESVRPSLDVLTGFSFPTIDKDDYIIPARMVQEVRIVNPEDLDVRSAKKESSVVVASHLLPKNATWEALDIKFLDGHLVKVSYPGMKPQKFDYKDMGFMNTKTNNPDYKWALLRIMAEYDGSLTKSEWDKRFGRNVKYELNEGLKKFFGMKSSPISHYTKRYGYKALFSLRADK